MVEPAALPVADPEHPRSLYVGSYSDLRMLFDNCSSSSSSRKGGEYPPFAFKGEEILTLNISTFVASGTIFQNKHLTFLRAFPHISTLNLSFNALTDRLEGLSSLAHLRVLDLSHNELISIGKLGDLRSLEVLRLNDNYLEDLDSISSLSSLTELWVSNNKLKVGCFVYCLRCKGLRIVVKYGNKIDEDKAYLIDSLLNLLPTIQFIDNSRVTSVCSASAVNPSIVSRLQAVLNQKQKAFFYSNFLSMSVGIKSSNGDSPNNSPRRDNSNQNVPATISTRSVSPQPLHKARSDLIYSVGNELSMSSMTSTEVSSVTFKGLSAASKRLAYQMAQKIKAPPIANFKAQRTSDVATVLSPRQQQEYADTGAYSSAIEVPLAMDVSTQKRSRTKESTVLQPLSTSSTPTPTTIIFFGNRAPTDGAAREGNIALCINDDDSGYCKYEKKGVVAASFESERLFAFYRNGSIAANLDSSSGRCNGSVQDSKGNCVLVIKGDVCTAMDSRGNKLGTYHRQTSSTADNDSSLDHLLKWSFDGPRVSFNTSTWELLIKVQNEKAKCLFSNICPHVRLLEEIDYSPVAVAAAGRKKKQQSTVRSAAALKEFSFDDHTSVRNELSSMILSLDGMMTKYKSEKNRK